VTWCLTLHMKSVTRRIGFTLIALLLLAASYFYYHQQDKVDVLTKKSDLKIKVNGVAVRGEVLKGRFTDLVTIREKGKEHTYFLYWQWRDNLEPMPVMDCRKWVAPKFPVYIAIRGYSNRCEDWPDVGWQHSALWFDTYTKQFATPNGDVISLVAQ